MYVEETIAIEQLWKDVCTPGFRRSCTSVALTWQPGLADVSYGALTNRFTSAIWADPDVIPYALRVSVWGRWFICFLNAFELAYRPSFWYHNDMGYLFQLVPVVTLNDLVHFRLLTNRPVTWRWVLLLSAVDIALVAASMVVWGGCDRFVFVAFCPALVLFARFFTPVWLKSGLDDDGSSSLLHREPSVGLRSRPWCGRWEGAGSHVCPGVWRLSHHPIRTHGDVHDNRDEAGPPKQLIQARRLDA